MSSHQGGRLLSERYVFQHQIRARTEKLASQERQEPEQAEHEISLTRANRSSSAELHLQDSKLNSDFGESQLDQAVFTVINITCTIPDVGIHN